ncbi:hypothetical protein BK634_28750 [Pseudomonas chlororaphis]|nr:hypothetical protein BK634_28750 [Pseudomonas chlororaphis]
MDVFRKCSFVLRFHKPSIVQVPHSVQLHRAECFLAELAEVHPLLGDWFFQAGSKRQALGKRLQDHPGALQEEAARQADEDFPTQLEFSVWNGVDDPLQGGLAFHYSAHDGAAMAGMHFEDAGALVMAVSDVKSLVLQVMQLALERWPEIDWCVFAPSDHYRRGKVFKDRQTIGWIGFCPHLLQAQDFADAEQLIEVAGRGTLIVSTPQLLDERTAEHVQRVANIDSTLMELGLLPLFTH